MYVLKKKVAHVTQDWTVGAREVIAQEIEGSGNLDRDTKQAARYQGSLDRKVESPSNEEAAEKKTMSKPSLRPPKYKAPPKKVETVKYGEESDDKFDAMLDYQLRTCADNVPFRDEDEEVT